MARTLITIVAAMALTGCTTLQPVTGRDGVAPGDRVRVVTTEGVHELTVTEITAGELVGRAADGRVRSIPFPEIRTLEKRVEPSGYGAVALGILGGVALVLILSDDDSGGY